MKNSLVIWETSHAPRGIKLFGTILKNSTKLSATSSHPYSAPFAFGDRAPADESQQQTQNDGSIMHSNTRRMEFAAIDRKLSA